MDDVLIVGAGPAGAVAATVLARAGARVRLLDRAAFPRDKLCGDTLNPGTMALLRRLDLAGAAERRGLPIAGMRVTGEGVDVTARYPGAVRGRAISRRDLDLALVEEAIRSGAEFEPGVAVREPVSDGRRVCGVVIGAAGSRRSIRAPVTIAADGRKSTLAFQLGLSRHPAHPRRFVAGCYFEGVGGMAALGEMHIRRGHYIGVAPLPGGLANVCLVKPAAAGDVEFRDPAGALAAAVARDPALRERFRGARPVCRTTVLGPLAVDSAAAARLPDGLLLAGDAAGFVDPMTGDGMRFAVRGGELAAHAALDALEHGWHGVQRRVAVARRADFAGKWRFNRTLRALVGSPAAVRLAGAVAPLAPAVLRALVMRAGDCGLAAAEPQPLPSGCGVRV
jgi:flavin-dependent dehydrogenase